MTKVLGLAAVLEAATGLVLIIHPGLIAQGLFGDGVAGAGMALSRVAGFALLALGVACWPGREAGSGSARSLGALLTYSLLVTLYLVSWESWGTWQGYCYGQPWRCTLSGCFWWSRRGATGGSVREVQPRDARDVSRRSCLYGWWIHAMDLSSTVCLARRTMDITRRQLTNCKPGKEREEHPCIIKPLTARRAT